MPILRLTEKNIAALAPPTNKPQETYHDDRLRGFVLIVGKRSRTFAVKRDVDGKKVKVKIGRHGQARADGMPWTATLARQRALELMGEQVAEVAAGPAADEPTLRDGLELHLEAMHRRNRSPRSIRTLDTEIRKYFADWLDRPISELTGPALDAHLTELMASVRPRAGSVNPRGAALTKRLVAQVSACWNALDRLHELPGRNPATKVVTHALKPKGERLHDLADWHARVMTCSPVRRDFQIFGLFSGMRVDSLRHLRWDDFDEAAGILHIERAKGSKKYTIPLSATLREIIERRRAENPIEFGPYGGDHGWIFPSLTRAKPYQVIPLAEPKEQRTDKTGARVNFLPGMHTLRRTFNSVAMEVGIAREDRERLLNHSGQGVNVRFYGFPANWDRLAECQAKIEAALWARINGQGK